MTRCQLPPASREPCACGRPAEVHLAATALCRWCWLAELDRLQRVLDERKKSTAAKDSAMRTPPAPANDGHLRAVWCPVHRRAWHSFVAEVHGVHDPEHRGCNGRAVPLLEERT